MSQPTGPRLVVGLVVGVVAVQALMLFAFALPAVNSGPREVPVAVAGPPEAVAQVEQVLASTPGRDADVPAFDVSVVEDQEAATEAIADREVYGAVVVSPDGPQLLVGSAASPAVAQLLRSVAGPVPVRDVFPTTPDDPNGSGLAVGVLPLVMTSAAGGLAAAILIRRTGSRFAVLIGLTVIAGLAAAALLEYGLGVTEGSYWPLAGVLALLVGGVAAAVAGLGAVLGRAGAGLGMLLMIFLGNPFSAAASAPEMLPQPWGDIGQLMPPGAGASAVRSVAFFDGAALAQPVLVLSIWLVVGLVLTALGGLGRSTVDDESAGNVLEHGESEVGSNPRV